MIPEAEYKQLSAFLEHSNCNEEPGNDHVSSSVQLVLRIKTQ